LNEADAGFSSVCFSPDGKYLAAGSWRRKRTLFWDVQARTLVKEIPFGSDVLCVAFSPDGGSVAIAGRTDTVEIWDVRGWVKRHVLHGNGSWLTSIAYSPDGKSLVAASPAGEIKFWRASTGEPTGSLLVDRGIRRAFFAPNGNGIVWASMDGTVEYWSATPAEEIPGLGLQPEE
jgi:WD40 repeat protein